MLFSNYIFQGSNVVVAANSQGTVKVWMTEFQKFLFSKIWLNKNWDLNTCTCIKWHPFCLAGARVDIEWSLFSIETLMCVSPMLGGSCEKV